MFGASLVILLLVHSSLVLSQEDVWVGLAKGLSKARPYQEFLFLSKEPHSKGEGNFVKELQQDDIPLIVMNVDKMSSTLKRLRKEEQKCEVFLPTNNFEHTLYGEHIYNQERLHILRHSSSRQKTILASEKSVSAIYELLEMSTIDCPAARELGLLEDDNWIFLLEGLLEEGAAGRNLGNFSAKHPNIIECEKVLEKVHLTHMNGQESKGIRTQIVSNLEDLPREIKNFMSIPTSFEGAKFTALGGSYGSYCLIGGDYGSIMGTNERVLATIAKKINVNLNFDYELFEKGYILNGAWNFNLGALNQENGDVVICNGGYYWDVLQMFEVTFPIDDPNGVVYYAPVPVGYRDAFAIALPFSPLLWLLIFMTWLIISLTQTLIARGSARDESTRSVFARPSECVWYCFGTLVGEALTRHYALHKTEALRILVGIWIIFCFLISYAYGGVLRSMLTRLNFTAPLRTWEDLRNWEEGTVSLDNSSFFARFMKEPNSGVQSFDAVISQAKLSNQSALKNLETVIKGSMAYIGWKGESDALVKSKFTLPNGDQLLRQGDEAEIIFPSQNSWMFNQLSPFFPIINGMLKRLFETGCIVHIKDSTTRDLSLHHKQNFGSPPEAREAPNQPMTLDNLKGPFLLLGFGLAFAIICFLVESFSTKKKNRVIHLRERRRLANATIVA